MRHKCAELASANFPASAQVGWTCRLSLEASETSREQIQQEIAVSLGEPYCNYDSLYERLMQPDNEESITFFHVAVHWKDGADDVEIHAKSAVAELLDVLLAPFTLDSWGYRVVIWENIVPDVSHIQL